jgi:mono/diheme cytochrome c family protein
MGVCTMRCSLNLLVPAMVLATSVAALAQAPTAQAPAAQTPQFNVGKPLSQEEIRSFDFMIGPQGQQLPAGRGTAKEGEAIFAKRCEVCHGKNGERGVLRRLVMGSPGKPYRGPFKAEEKDSVAYYPYATIAWDYINRAMPVPKPGSLTHDEVYALVAFLLYRNGIIQETDVMDANSLPKVEMPNRNGFVPAVPVYPPDPTKPNWF